MKFIEPMPGLNINLNQIDKNEVHKFDLSDLWTVWVEVTKNDNKTFVQE